MNAEEVVNLLNSTICGVNIDYIFKMDVLIRNSVSNPKFSSFTAFPVTRITGSICGENRFEKSLGWKSYP